MDLTMADQIASVGIVNNLLPRIRNILVDIKEMTIDEISGSDKIEIDDGFDDGLVLDEIAEILAHLRKRPTNYDEFSDSSHIESAHGSDDLFEEIRKMLVDLRFNRIRRMTRRNRGLKKSPKKRRLLEENDHQDQEAERRFKRKRSSTTSHHRNKKRKTTHKKNNGVKRASKNGPETPADAPTWLVELIEETGGYEERLVIQKYLSDSDIRSNQSRLSMPVRQLQCQDDFLTEEESRDVWVRKVGNKTRIKGINVPVYESRESKWEFSLRKWQHQSTISYVFAGKWRDFVKKNALKAGDPVQIRFFRSGNGIPCFAFVNVTKGTPSSSSAVAPLVAEENQQATDPTAPC